MSKWFGEQREWTDNEKTFMVKAAAACRACQEEGQCTWGSKDCCTCKWQAPMAAIKELDSFTQSRIEDKADMLDMQGKLFVALCDRAEQEQRHNGLKLFILFALVAVIVAAAVSVLHAEPYTSKVSAVMKQLSRDGPTDWYCDGKIDCKDWSVSFMDMWYSQGNLDGTCLLVHNYGNGMNHLMVAVYDNGMHVIEPQACYKKDWSPESFWGREYDKQYNRLYETWIYLAHADKDTKLLMRRCGVSESEYYANLNGRKMPWEE